MKKSLFLGLLINVFIYSNLIGGEICFWNRTGSNIIIRYRSMSKTEFKDVSLKHGKIQSIEEKKLMLIPLKF